MLLGYYYADGRYGDHFEEQSAYTNLYRVSRSGWLGDPRGETVAAVQSIRRAVERGKHLQIALDIGSQNVGGQGWKPYLRAVLAELRRLDADLLVSGIELRDEPNWSPVVADQRASAVRSVLGDRLRGVPLGLTFDAADVLAGRVREVMSSLYGYVACEAYLEPRVYDPGDAQEEASRLVSRMRRKVPSHLDYWLVGMSYDRDADGQPGGLRVSPPAAIKAAQHGTYEAARAAGAQAIVWFSFGRPGGVITYPGLVRVHRSIARSEGVL